MTPIFWKYLVTNGDGSEIRFVAEQDRDWAEKEMEADPRLLSYRANPQIQSSVLSRPAERVLQRLRRARVQQQKTEMNHMHDSVVAINNTHWPAYRKENGTLVDLRLFDPNDRSPKPRLVFCPEKLSELGIPAAFIEAAAQSDPQGLILFQDVPDRARRAEEDTEDQATTSEQSAT
jgi:hypothetical protein